MSIKDEFPLDESDLSPEEAELYKRLKAERDNANCDVDDYELLDNIVHRERSYDLDQVESIIRDLISERADQKRKRDTEDNYDRAMKGLA